MPTSKIDTSIIPKVVLIAWIVFASLYFVYGEYSRLKNFVYNQGLSDAVVTIIQKSQECQVVPLTVGNFSASVVNVDCLKAPEGATADDES